MARIGDLRLDGDDVLEALSECNARTNYERKLTADGITLAHLIADVVIERIQAGLARKDGER